MKHAYGTPLPPALLMLTTSPPSTAAPKSEPNASRLQPFLRATRLLFVVLVAGAAVAMFAPRNHIDRAEAATQAQAQSPAQPLAPAPAPEAAVAEITDRAGLVAAINEARAAKGLAILQSDPILDAGAQQWADAMAAQLAVSHDPQLTAGYSDDWRRMGENVSTGFSISVLHAASLKSAAATVLDPNATLVGVGISVQPGGVYLVERTVS